MLMAARPKNQFVRSMVSVQGLALKAQQRHHDAGGERAVEMDMLEEAVEAPLHRGERRIGLGMSCQPPQAHRALAHDEDHEPGQRLAS